MRDPDAEKHLIADLFLNAPRIDEARDLVRIDDFDNPYHAGIFEALCEARADGLQVIDKTVVRYVLEEHKRFSDEYANLLEELTSYDWGTGAWAKHARIVAERAHARGVARAAYQLAQAVADGEDTTDRYERLEQARQPRHSALERPSVDVDELLAEDDPEYDWLVPGLLERADRVILTAAEGHGKSTLLRQIAIRIAIGQHPFTGEPMDPLSVLYVDCENGRRHVRRQLRKLRATASDAYQPGRLRFEFRPNGLDLLKPADVAWLASCVATNQPDLLMIGPLYKMAAGDPLKEETARAVAGAIDDMRARTGLTIILEAHTPYAENGRAKRPIRPYGASLWSRWPEFGICLTDTGALAHWRGQREERAWPPALDRATPWPWAPRDATQSEQGEVQSLECIEAIVQLLERYPTEEFSARKLITRLRDNDLSYRDEVVRASAKAAVAEGRIGFRLGPKNAHMYSANKLQEELGYEEF